MKAAKVASFEEKLDRLTEVLSGLPDSAVAVSGGVDSTTLAIFAKRRSKNRVNVYHAVSPAVPPRATARVKKIAALESWQLFLVDAGEFDDDTYRQNPVNRCFYCKKNLYSTISDLTHGVILSGTNCDDLADFRPGLTAAAQAKVRHPYVEAGFAKSDVRALAEALGYLDLARLPAAPCLSSRVETGLPIQPASLLAIDQAEDLIKEVLRPRIARCRLRKTGVAVELDPECLNRMEEHTRQELAEKITRLFPKRYLQSNGIAFLPYRQGSAFLRDKPHV